MNRLTQSIKINYELNNDQIIDNNIIGQTNIIYSIVKLCLDKDLFVLPVTIYNKDYKLYGINKNKINIKLYQRCIIINGCKSVDEINLSIKYIRSKYLKEINLIRAEITYICKPVAKL